MLSDSPGYATAQSGGEITLCTSLIIISIDSSVYRYVFFAFQCGADSLGNDRLGCFNLTTKGHGFVPIISVSVQGGSK